MEITDPSGSDFGGIQQFAASSSSSPILVVGSGEGLLYLLDHRDGRNIEVIDNAAGRATSIEGICFLDAEQFAVLDQAGTVRLYSLAGTLYENALRYLDEAEWDINEANPARTVRST
jgi:hypothetical protein